MQSNHLITEVQDMLKEDSRNKMAAIYRAPSKPFKEPRREGPKSLCPTCNRFFNNRVIGRHKKACAIEADPIGELERSFRETAESFWSLSAFRDNPKAAGSLERWEVACRSLIRHLRKIERGE